jgi:hypothetical protein
MGTPLYQFWLEIYDAKVMAAGNPPLTRGSFEKHITLLQWYLDFPFTEANRQQYLELVQKEWPRLDRAKNIESFKSLERDFADFLRMDRIQTACARAASQADYVKRLRASTDESDLWLVRQFDAARVPGGDRNAILVAGDPPLTQDLVKNYGDYAQWALNLSYSRGLTEPQRQVLQELLINDWKKMDQAATHGFVEQTKKWLEIMQANPSEYKQWRAAMQPKFLAYLASTRDLQHGSVLLAAHEKERELEKLMAQLEEKRHQGVMDAIRRLEGPAYEYRWMYNGGTNRYEYRYVPKQ